MSRINYVVSAKFEVNHNVNPIYDGESEEAAILYFKAAVAQGLNDVKIVKHIHSTEYLQIIDGEWIWS